MTGWLAALFFLLLQDAPLADPQEEARAQALMREIRCVACENEPISQSAADIAEDMRRVVREQVAAGRSDADIRDWFAERYGDFVLFRPPARDPSGWLLWGLPFVLLAGGLGAVLAVRRRARREDIKPVPPEDL